MKLYGELAPWWPLLSAPEDYEEEAGLFHAALRDAIEGPQRTLLELGSGGGNTASHLRAHWRMTLVDRSTEMLVVSSGLNSDCEHVQGDMRSVRLGRTFDAVLIHDAIMYLTDEQELAAALATARVHCRPGGAALFVPDDTRETFRPGTSHGGHDAPGGVGRGLRYLEWRFEPRPGASSFQVAYAFLLRHADGSTAVVHDVHTLGLFPRATWLKTMGAVGFRPRPCPYPHSSFAPDSGRELFVGV